MKLEAAETKNQTKPKVGYGIQVLTIDDHALVRVGLELLVQEIAPQTQVVHASSATEALLLTKENPYFDLILLDINIPGMDGLYLLPQLRQISPDASVIVITGNEDSSMAEKALALGAKTYLTKNTDSGIIKRTLADFIREHQKKGVPDGRIRLEQKKADTQELSSRFTTRQLQVLECMAQGMSNKEISSAVFLSEGTVKNHITSIFGVLGVSNRTQAVVAATQYNLL